jgi:hypothetical protein
MSDVKGERIEMGGTEQNPNDAIIDARMAELTARFGDRLSEKERAQVRSRIGSAVTLGQALRQVTFSNADEPEIVFTPYRMEERR